MIKGFRDFIARGNVIDLAVAVIMGAAFGAVVSSIVKNIITPLIALIVGQPDFSQIRTGPLMWGNVLNDILTFLITAIVVYFVIVVPMNRVMSRFAKPAEAPAATRKCPECLSVIPAEAHRCAFCTAEVTPELARVAPRT